MLESITNIKNISYMITMLVGLCCGYLGIEKETIIILSVLMLIDTFVGFVKAKTLNKSPSSKRLTRGFLSKVLLLLIPITLALGGKGIGIDMSGIIISSFLVLIVSEMYSIMTSIYVIRTKEDVKEFDAISLMLKVIRKNLAKIISAISIDK